MTSNSRSSSYASMPFDNVKTRMQSTGKSGMRMTSVASQMLASEGLLVFWRATTPRLVRLTVSTASFSSRTPADKDCSYPAVSPS
jgi:hypothetical protein